ncbi:hypothetical protein BRC85_07650 [Halobacteriales archaeon QS_1_69_70]|nr:MAG: hypothetical protein BRC85_07650 [Halobacteriales archaeon QS_1_69_70]
MEDDSAGRAPPFAGGGGTVHDHWDDLVADMAATAADLSGAGREVLELHPADVTVVSRSRRGFDVLVPDDEFETLREWVDGATFPEHRVYRAEAGLVFLLVVLDDPDAGLAVCCPLYYEPSEAETLRELAGADGELRTHVRRLSESYVTLTHDDVEPFLPE